MYYFIGGTPDKHGVLERCFPIGFYRGIDPHSGFVCSHSGCVCPHSGYVCCIMGEQLINMRPLNVVFRYVFTEELTHTVVSSAHTVVICVVRRRRGAALVNTGT